MERVYRNPCRRVKNRAWITPADDKWEIIRDVIFHEDETNDLLYYCEVHHSIDHSIESKYTVKKHYEKSAKFLLRENL